MEIITLIENLVYNGSLKGEHGLSFLIKTDECKILFDVGQTGALLDNAESLGEELGDVDFIILSHGHYDHTGGLEQILEINKTAKVIMKKNILEVKYSNSGRDMREIGFKLQDRLRDYPNEFIFLEEDYLLIEGIKVIAEIGEYTDFEKIEQGLFIRERNSYVADKFSDELFLIVEKDERLNVITGCSHNGIINILKSAINKTGIESINLLLGGMHLSTLKADQEVLKKNIHEKTEKTIQELKKIEIKKIYTNHCTGIDGFMKLKSAMGEKVYYSYTGSRIRVSQR